MNILRYGLLAGVAVLAVGASTPLVSAQTQGQEVQTQATERRQAAEAKAAEKRQAAETHAAEAKQLAEQKTTEAGEKVKAAKLKACEKKEKVINRILTKVSERGTKQLEVFTTISDRTQAFYKEKGNTVADYEALVAAVTEKKAAGEAAVAASKDATFTCDSENPKAFGETLKTTLQTQNKALLEYKLAVKNLIEGVKSAQVQDTAAEANTSTREEQ